MLEEPKKYQTLESRLYLENSGTIEIHAEAHTSSEPEIEVKVWNTSTHKYLWRGTSEEFWKLVLAGIASLEAIKVCPKCGGKDNSHLPNCPIVLLAKKEGPEDET